MSSGNPRPLTLDLIFKSKALDDKPLRAPQWLSDNRRIAYLDLFPSTRRTTVWTVDTDTGERKPLFDPNVLKTDRKSPPLPIHAIVFSKDERRLLLTSAAPARFTPCGDLYVYDLAGSKLTRLTRTDAAQRHPRFSPDGSSVGFVRDSDLWVVDVLTGEERRLTADGTGTRYNGRCGWVYEEELGLGCAWEWSPDGRSIGFLQQDEAAVPEVLLSQYDQPHCDPLRTRYPKAGDPNPTARAGILDVETGDVRWADLSQTMEEPPEERYIAHLQWAPDGGELLLQAIPRIQNRLLLLGVSRSDLDVRSIIDERDDAWVDHPGKLHFVGESDEFLWPSDRDGWRHLYLYNLRGDCVRQVTRGEWEAAGVCAADGAGRCAYITAGMPSPTDRSLLRVPLDGGEPVRLAAGEGVHSALFSPDASRYLHTRSALNLPPVTKARTTAGADLLTLTEDSAPALRRCGVPIGERDAGTGWELMTFRTEDGVTLHARMLKPSGFDPSRRYPVLMHTYGGPGSQVVLNQWGGKSALWYHYLARRGYLIFLCDNRGTGARGRDFKKLTYLRLGDWEVRDQIAGARYLAGLPYVDARRIAIWGWSYGGYMASMLILQGADVFRAAVAVAPVTDWRLYDTIYTERYMRRPDDNAEGYREGSPVSHARKLRGRFLLIHGALDDNVHFQNAARLASALQDAGKPFETMFYPGKRHGIEGRHRHLYGLMSRFLQRALR